MNFGHLFAAMAISLITHGGAAAALETTPKGDAAKANSGTRGSLYGRGSLWTTQDGARACGSAPSPRTSHRSHGLYDLQGQRPSDRAEMTWVESICLLTKSTASASPSSASTGKPTRVNSTVMRAQRSNPGPQHAAPGLLRRKGSSQ